MLNLFSPMQFWFRLPLLAASSTLHIHKTIWQNQDGDLGNMYAFTENTQSLSDFDQQTKTFAVPMPEYSDPDWAPEPSRLTQEQIRELVAEWLG